MPTVVAADNAQPFFGSQQLTPEHSQQRFDGLSDVADGTVISRSPSALAAEVESGILVMSIDRGAYFTLNDVGSDIWRRLDQPRSFAELIDQLSAEYHATKETIAGDVRSWLRQMIAQDIVRLA